MFKATVTNTKVSSEDLITPIECFGTDENDVFQMYTNGEPDNSYLIGTGMHDRPLYLWWCEEEDTHRVSSSSEEDLRGFLSHIMFKRIDADFTITLEVK